MDNAEVEDGIYHIDFFGYDQSGSYDRADCYSFEVKDCDLNIKCDSSAQYACWNGNPGITFKVPNGNLEAECARVRTTI